MKHTYLFLLITLLGLSAIAQENAPSGNSGVFSGSFYANANGFVRNNKIGATTPLYTQALSAVEGWFTGNYNSSFINASIRYDMYHNSNLLTPNEPYTNNGIGFWQLNKSVAKFDFTVGSIYDQFGTGSIFRAFWEPFIGIDNALTGARVIYRPNDNLSIKVLSGKQKYRFSTWDPILKGVNVEKNFPVKERINATLGASLVNRTLDKQTMSGIVDNINAYPLENRFVPKYNEFAYQVYTNTTIHDINFSAEYAHKTPDMIRNESNTALVLKAGDFIQAALGYSHMGKRGIGVNLQYRKLNNFEFRTAPLEKGLNGLVNYLPSITRQNTYRLMARYNAVTQFNNEQTLQADITYSHNEKNSMTLNGSYVTGINNELLFREVYFDWLHTFNDHFKLLGGVQTVFFNQAVLQGEPEALNVKTFTPFAELNYDISDHKSLRVEAQYLSTKQDSGSFVNIMADFNISPHWSFSAGDMVNIIPRSGNEKIHYYTLFAAYSEEATRVALAYVKQLAGFNCNGGICRYEPAFNGVKLTISTTF